MSVCVCARVCVCERERECVCVFMGEWVGGSVVSVLVKCPVLPSCAVDGCCWMIQRSWFARVNALCNLSHKKSREVAMHFQANF